MTPTLEARRRPWRQHHGGTSRATSKASMGPAKKRVGDDGEAVTEDQPL